MSDLIKLLDTFDKRSKEIEKAGSVPTGLLPLTPAGIAGVPNSFLRSSLFSVVKKGRRNLCHELEISSTEGLSIKYSGLRLNQNDLDVWEQCLFLAQESDLGSVIEFTAGSFLEAIERGRGKSQYDWLEASIKRLAGALVSVSDEKREYFGALIQEGIKDKETGHYTLRINPSLSVLYNNNGWTKIKMAERLSLKKDLSKWLHGFYSTHSAPFHMKVSTIYRLCGSETKELWRFRQSLKVALTELSEVTNWKCSIDSTDKIVVQKMAVRHIR